MSEAQYNLSKQELLDKIKQGYDELFTALRDLDDTQDTTPGPYPDSDWTIKDTLAHLTACTQSMISRLPGHQPIPYPVEAETGESWDSHVQRMNDYWYQRDKDKPMAQVAAEFGKTYRQLLQEVEALSDAQLADPKVQSLIAGDSYEHYAEHLGYIKDWLEQQEPVLISKTEVLTRMAKGHDQLLAALAGLSDAQMTTPGPYPDSAWTVKDTLAHLAVWMRSMVSRLPGGAGKPYPLEEQPDEGHDNFIERVNEYWYQRDKDKPLAEVRSEFEAAYQQLYAAVEALSAEQIAERDTQYRIGGNTYWHFEEHLGYIGDWLKQHEHPHISKADMLARMASAHNELMGAISNLSDAQMTTPGPYPDSAWTVKDTLAHLAAWMRANAMLLHGNGKPYPFEEQPDESEDHFVERVNEYWYQRDKDEPLAEVRSEFEAAYQQQFAAMEALSDEQAVEPTHVKEHLGIISDWLKRQKEQA